MPAGAWLSQFFGQGGNFHKFQEFTNNTKFNRFKFPGFNAVILSHDVVRSALRRQRRRSIDGNAARHPRPRLACFLLVKTQDSVTTPFSIHSQRLSPPATNVASHRDEYILESAYPISVRSDPFVAHCSARWMTTCPSAGHLRWVSGEKESDCTRVHKQVYLNLPTAENLFSATVSNAGAREAVAAALLVVTHHRRAAQLRASL